MNHVSKFSALVVGIATLACSPAMFAQAAAPQPTAAAPVAPQAIPAKIALIAFEQAVFATNEGQKALGDVGKKYEPQKNKIAASEAEIESLQKQLQAATTISEEDRASRVRTIDAKQKALQRDGEDAQTAYQNDLQEAYQKVAQKFNVVMQKYASDNGYTLMLDVSGQQSAVLFAAPQTDVTRAVIDAYNTSSGVAAQPAAGPAPARTAPRPAAPKPAAK
ncbi:OmpH family outer membrane protein [Terriglobus roseus]|uniref:Periplasmic chaperone for outer membrane proteins Skp n=1 Tax=Terriglobus roseus TaxID=392734 RepID=A0A1H4MDL6_9BACT|nr:OmpH family outer membrane protein [Terriglobus roseus]SEB81109.1 periplasmic chaperone for outer membrane proteins Skp [Terriglobus roseus]